MKWENVHNLNVHTITQIFDAMKISYSITTVEGKLRTVHTIKIEGEQLVTTRAKEVLVFAKPRIFSKNVWKHLKECVRLGEPLEVMGGDLFGLDD